MGLLAEERPWSGHLLQGILRGKGPAAPPREWLPFDLADAMEQGFACDVSTRFEEAQSDAAVREMAFCQSEDMSEYHLLGQNGQPVLIARPRGADKRSKSFDIFVAGDGQPPQALGPAFRLAHLKDAGRWELRSEFCPMCEYRSPTRRPNRDGATRMLLKIEQEVVDVGPGTCMSVDITWPKQDEPGCSVCRLNAGASSPSNCWGPCMTTRRPRWSARLRSLTLEFKGRCDEASERNFQITRSPLGEGTADDVVLQFGKMASGGFCLDFKGPFGPVQAFAAALTTTHWR